MYCQKEAYYKQLKDFQVTELEDANEGQTKCREEPTPHQTTRTSIGTTPAKSVVPRGRCD